MKNIKLCFFILLFTLTSILCSCNIGIQNPNTTTSNNGSEDNLSNQNENTKSYFISGKFPSSTSRGLEKTISTENTLWVIPIYSDSNFSISPDVFSDKTEYQINDNGLFNVELSTDFDKYIILVLDLTEDERKNQLIGYIDLDGLIMFPKDNITDDIDLGDMELDGDEVTSETTLNGASSCFTYDINDLEVLCEMDDKLKIIQNHYLNLDTEVFTNQGYTIKANIDDILTETGISDYNVNNYELRFYCDNYFDNSDNVKLVQAENTEDYSISSNSSPDSATKYFTSFSDPDSISQGIWILEDGDGNQQGEYNISLINILDENNKFNIPLPYISGTKEENHLTKFTLNWKIEDTAVSGNIVREFIDETSLWIQSNTFDGTLGSWDSENGLDINDDFTEIEIKKPIPLTGLDEIQFGFNTEVGSIELVYN
jgi:hypothetical protein